MNFRSSLILICAVGALVGCAKGPASRKAWDMRDTIETKWILSWGCDTTKHNFTDGGKACRDSLPKEKAFAIDPRMKDKSYQNFLSNTVPDLPRTQDIVGVQISPMGTDDDGSHWQVVTVIDAEGKGANFWLHYSSENDGYVRAITPHEEFK